MSSRTATHAHRAIPDRTSIRGFIGHSVDPGNENRTAHGGITRYEYCKCGAVRMTNSTGRGRDEKGPWEPRN